MNTAARLLYDAAGRPPMPGSQPVACTCWWCGLPSTVALDQDKTIPDTFGDSALARSKSSEWICTACAWTLCERVAIPKAYAARRMATIFRTGRRFQGVVCGEPAAKYLGLELAGGQIGLWSLGSNAKAEEGWTAAVSSLRSEPRDIGPCRFLRAVDAADIAPDATEKFRSYHHFGGTGLPWSIATDSDKAWIRNLLQSPPVGEWCAVIGDGKKHAAIFAQISPGAPHGIQSVYFRPLNTSIYYNPAHFAEVVTAVDLCRAAGWSDEEIRTGQQVMGTTRDLLDMIPAWMATEAILDPQRALPLMDLALYLGRPRTDLRDDPAIVAALRAPTEAIIAALAARGEDGREEKGMGAACASLRPETGALPEVQDGSVLRIRDAGAGSGPGPDPDRADPPPATVGGSVPDSRHGVSGHARQRKGRAARDAGDVQLSLFGR